MDISIIVPCYKSEHTIDICINSILGQNYNQQAWELIIVDDTLNNSSLDKYENKENITVIKNDENLGLAASRNVGINNSTGNLLIFIDSDMELEKGWVESFGTAGLLRVNKLVSSRQACDIFQERARVEPYSGKLWIWHHVCFFWCADYWRIPPTLGVAHCYYSNWGAPPPIEGDQLKESVKVRAFQRSEFMLNQLKYYNS